MALKRLLILLFISVQTLFVIAQNERSTLGRFSVNYNAGCTPFQVSITELVPLGQTFYNFTGTLVSTRQFTYNQPGQYTIYQFIQDDDNPQGKVDSVKITLRQPQDPDFSIFTCPGNLAAAQINDTYYDFYRVYFSNGDSADVRGGERSPYKFIAPSNPSTIRVKGFFTGGSPSCPSTTKSYTPQQDIPRGEIASISAESDSTVTIALSISANADYFLEKSENNGLFKTVQQLTATQNNITVPINNLVSNCYRVTTQDACSGLTLASDTVCSITLRALSTTNGNQLRWNAVSSGDSIITLLKNDSVLFTGKANTFFDTDLLCQKTDCYTLRYGKATSNEVCVTANKIFNLGPPRDMQSTFEGKEVVLTWDIPGNPPIREYELGIDEGSRIINPTIYEYRLSPDLNKDPQRYNINYRDLCNNISAFSNVTSPVYFNLDLIEGNKYIAKWTNYEGWPEGVSGYFLERQNDDESWTSSSLPNNASEFEIELVETANTFRIAARSDSTDSRTSYSNVISIGKSVLVSIPTAFTPDSNGLNDVFLVKAERISNYKMVIFNRWGEAVFESEDITVGWDGTYKGKKMLTGTFTYRLEFENENGEQETRIGNVVLIRKN